MFCILTIHLDNAITAHTPLAHSHVPCLRLVSRPPLAASGIRAAEEMLDEHALVAMQSDEVESYHEESQLMMKMIEK